MDVHLARTFLEVASCGSFVAAAERLHVTQSTVSVRIQKLEDMLGKRLFERSKSGVEMTSYGEQFEPSARALLLVWEEARYAIAVPDGFTSSLSIGSQYSLWPELAINWLEAMEREMPQVAFSVHLGMPDRLNRLMTNGLIDMSVVYSPEIRPGFKAEHVMDDYLVHVTTDPQHRGGLDERYVFMNWGEEFAAAHSRWYPDFRLSRTTLLVGAAAVTYILRNSCSAYLPSRVVKEYLEVGKLHLVPNAPEMAFPAFLVWTTGKDDALITAARRCLLSIVSRAPDSETYITSTK